MQTNVVLHLFASPLINSLSVKPSRPVCTYFMEGPYLTVYTWASKADLNQPNYKSQPKFVLRRTLCASSNSTVEISKSVN